MKNWILNIRLKSIMMNNNLITYLLLVFFPFPFAIFAQDQIPEKGNIEILSKLSQSFDKEFLEKKNAAIQWAEKKQIPVRKEFLNGRIIELQYLDENFMPVFYETRNSGAAKTTSVNQLHPMGRLQLYLTGNIMTAGIWDGGRVDPDHQELTSRVKLKDSGIQSNHATHVGGTIIAKGITKNAMGMAPDAELHSYDWNNDLSEMATAAANGLLISNHSYGIALGWGLDNGVWKWYAHPDSTYDYRFGYYSNTSKALDQITFNAPQYLIIWAAGNDRTDYGDSSRPPDGPYNSIGPAAVAKNVMAVGAVHKLTQAYANPSDIIMSNFSSWGPANDGRIKPDIVGAGVQLYSTISNNSYASYSGTSMASPNVTGSLLLLQQLFKYLSPDKSYMKASTLKGLAIHTTHEAGDFPGPDYQYGWGLLNTEMAARMLLFRDNTNFFVNEMTLAHGEVFELEFESDGSGDIVATISWTDPPANPVSPALSKSTIMLVNDLDLRIYNEAGNVTYSPWILNPQVPSSPASKGDNVRDNVEKITISAPAAGQYILKVSHKGELKNGTQDYSLLLQTKNIPQRKTLYWVGNEGSWSNPSNWSLSSGGISAGEVPTIEDHVIFDDKSFSQPPEQLARISLSDAAECYSLNWSSNKKVILEANNNKLSVFGPIYIGEQNQLSTTSLEILLTGNLSNNLISVGGPALLESSLLFNGEGSWEIKKDLQVNAMNLISGSVFAKNINLKVRELIVESSYKNTLDLRYSNVDNLNILRLFSNQFDFLADNSNLNFSDNPNQATPALLFANNHEFWNITNRSSHLLLNGANRFKSFTTAGISEISNNNVYNDFIIVPGAEVILKENSTQEILNLFSISSTADSIVSIVSDGSENAIIFVSKRAKLCFDFLNINRITALGNAVISSGLNSTVNNESLGWLTKSCDGTLFADFDYKYACKNGLTYFTDKSSGLINSWLWEFELNGSTKTDNLRNPIISFTETGNHLVQLSVTDENAIQKFSREIYVKENHLTPSEIIVSGTLYTSQKTVPSYQWFLNGVPIPNATLVSYNNINGLSGTFQVLITSDGCNILSNPIITSSPIVNSNSDNFLIYPNPFQTTITLEYSSNFTGTINFKVIDVWGKVIRTGQKEKFDNQIVFTEDLSTLIPGIYFIRIISGNEIANRKVIKIP